MMRREWEKGGCGKAWIVSNVRYVQIALYCRVVFFTSSSSLWISISYNLHQPAAQWQSGSKFLNSISSNNFFLLIRIFFISLYCLFLSPFISQCHAPWTEEYVICAMCSRVELHAAENKEELSAGWLISSQGSSTISHAQNLFWVQCSGKTLATS